MNIEEILRRIIREELTAALQKLPPVEGETIVDYETRTSTIQAHELPEVDEESFIHIPEAPVETIKSTKTISNTAELLGAMKELCDKPGMAAKAKALLKDEFDDVEKFGEVADHACQNVYDFMVLNKEKLV